ncbi:MAG: DNA polymerase III subunit delta [Candidatus Eisenbacteria bacterium]
MFPATLYVDGPDEPLKAAFLASFRHAWTTAAGLELRPRVLRTAETDVAGILAALQGGSLFANRELTLVFEIEDLGRTEKRVAALAAGLAHPGEGACLVLVESAADNARKSLDPLRSACAALWTAVAPDRAALVAWGERRLARDGVRAETGVVSAIADTCEGDHAAFFNELDKLATFAGPDGRLTLADVEALRRPTLDADLPEFLAAVAVGDPARAAQRLGRLLATGAGEGTVLFALANLVGGALGGWARWRELSETLRGRASGRDLARALDAIYRAEAAWKGGRAEVVTLLEHTTRVLSSQTADAARR